MLQPGDSRVAVVHGCFSEIGNSILSVFSWEPCIASEAARQLTNVSALQSDMISQDVHVRPSLLSCACAYADDRAGRAATKPIVNSIKLYVK